MKIYKIYYMGACFSHTPYVKFQDDLEYVAWSDEPMKIDGQLSFHEENKTTDLIYYAE